MSPDQIQVLQRHGMSIGSHGYDHFWLNTLSTNSRKVKSIGRFCFWSPWVQMFAAGSCVIRTGRTTTLCSRF